MRFVTVIVTEQNEVRRRVDIMKEYKIVVDTREQKPLWKKDVVTKKLDVGDYSIEGEEQNIGIERKSLPDLYGTLGSGHKRFKKELERALKLKYFAIVVDGSYSACLNKEFDGAHHSRMKGFVVTSIAFTIHMKYKVPIFFTHGRNESKRIIKELFNAYMKTKGELK